MGICINFINQLAHKLLMNFLILRKCRVNNDIFCLGAGIIANAFYLLFEVLSILLIERIAMRQALLTDRRLLYWHI